jgi:putative acetyltransferase
MPGKYIAEEGGGFLTAYEKGELAGCVAYRKLDNETCEMKRLYVRPGFRRRGLGGRLVQKVI